MDFLNDLLGKIKRTENHPPLQKEMERLCKIIANKPENPQTVIRLGDLLLKWGKRDEAIEAYTKAADKYAHKSLYKQAIAINKIIIRLDPTHKESSDAIADLQAKWIHMDNESIVGDEGLWAGRELSP
jgi:tetratricopeptide (TPR) repeat protein